MKTLEFEANDSEGKTITLQIALFSNKDYKSLKRQQNMLVAHNEKGLFIAIDESQEKSMYHILRQMGLET